MGSGKGARRKSLIARWRWPAAVLLIVLVGGVAGWWHLIHWLPSRQTYPVQGVLIGARDGAADFGAFKAIGADFAYIEASRGSRGQDPRFSENFADARAAGLKVGVVHLYNPCEPAERQAANFVTIVPRDSALLPPAIVLSMTTDECPNRVSDAAVESELTTFLNQIEGHVGKPALLDISPAFQQRYQIASRMDRSLWLQGDRVEPDYGGRPWTLWTANSSLRTEASDLPVRWVVYQP